MTDLLKGPELNEKAYADDIENRWWGDGPEGEDDALCSIGIGELVQRERAAARAEALEEAAAICDGIHMAEFKLSDGACAIGADCAEAIRALKVKP